MKQQLIKQISYALLFLGPIVACTPSQQPITEGTIIYQVDFPEISSEEHPLISMLLPKEQQLFFQNNTIVTRIKKATFEINMRANVIDSSFYSDLKFNDKTHLQLNKNNLEDLFSSLPNYQLEFKNDTDTLAGFNMNNVLVTTENGEQFEVWYTKEIELNHPNWYNPYREIPGVLMKYRIIQNGVIMDFQATQFIAEAPDQEDLSFEPKGKQLTFTEFQANIANLFENLMD